MAAHVEEEDSDDYYDEDQDEEDYYEEASEEDLTHPHPCLLERSRTKTRKMMRTILTTRFPNQSWSARG